MHCCRKTYQLQFSSCDQDSCRHCSPTPVCAERFLNIEQKNGDVLQTPTLSLIYKGHHDTMLHQLSAIESSQKSLGIDEGLPSLKGKSIALCPFGCRYMLSSHAGALRHCRLMDHTATRGWQSKLPQFK